MAEPAASRSSTSGGRYLCSQGHQWRIYFAPIDAEQRFILLLAVEKKKNERNPNDIEIAKRLLDAYRAKQAGAVPITFHR